MWSERYRINTTRMPGIGAKTAAALLAHFDTLDALLARVDEVPYLRLRGAAACAVRLREHRELALLCRELSTVACDVELDGAAGHFVRGVADQDRLHALCEQVRFGPMTRRRLYSAAGLEFRPGV